MSQGFMECSPETASQSTDFLLQKLSVQENLKRRIEAAELHLSNLQAALTMLESQPQLLETLNLLRKVGI